MDNNMITQVITRFNNLIDSLIEDFSEYKLDEEKIVFLAEKTSNFIDFSKIALINVVFGVLNELESTEYNYDNEIQMAEKLINEIFENINKSLDHILPDEDEEEHADDHSHHHHHVDVDAVQDDIDRIIVNLKELKNLLADVTGMVLLTLKYQAKEINEKVFQKEYAAFKQNIKNFKQEVENEM